MAGGIEFKPGRFKDLLLYASKRLADDPALGETKVNKVLFFSDFEAYRLLGRSITGAEYQKNKYGPTARMYTVMRDDLRNVGQLDVERRQVIDHVQDVLVPLVEPNLEQFTRDELEIVDHVIDELRQLTNLEASDLSHEQSAGWRAKKLGETIEYETALISPEPPSEEDMRHLRRLEGLPT